MAILNLFINLASSIFLLLFAIQTVKRGVERGFGDQIKLVMTKPNSPPYFIFAGLLASMALQSSTATIVLVSHFMQAFQVTFLSAISMAVGADIGSAISALILSYDMSKIIPILLCAGGYLFISERSEVWKQMGRMLIGVALIMISLRLLRSAIDPIISSDFFDAILGFANLDMINALLLGVVMTLLMHSSIAALISLVHISTLTQLPSTTALVMILGINMGSGLLALWHTRKQSASTRRLPLANLLMRSFSVGVVFFCLFVFRKNDMINLAPDQLILAHFCFNLLLLLLIFVHKGIFGISQKILPDPVLSTSTRAQILDRDVIEVTQLALMNARRQLIRTSDILINMSKSALDPFALEGQENSRVLERQHLELCEDLQDLRAYIFEMPFHEMSKQERKLTRQMSELAREMELSAGIISRQIVRISTQVRGDDFNDEEWNELESYHAHMAENMQLALGLIVNENSEIANAVINNKSQLKIRETRLRKSHFKTLSKKRSQNGIADESYFEMIHALHELISRAAAIAFIICGEKLSYTQTLVKKSNSHK